MEISENSNSLAGRPAAVLVKGSRILAAAARVGVAGACMLCSILLGPLSPSAFEGLAPSAAPGPVHGLWVWKSPTVLEAPRGAETLRDFCKSQGVNEVYVSVAARSEASEENELARLIALLHRSDIRVEALLSSTDADEPGKPREKLLDKAG